LGHEDRRPNAVNVRYWHLADIPETAINVRFRAKADISVPEADIEIFSERKIHSAGTQNWLKRVGHHGQKA